MWRRTLNRALALVAMGSGLLNLYSLFKPGLPQRTQLLQEVFPLALLHLSRFATLLLGLALVITSLNLYRRKKRAYQFAIALSALSVLFHLIKGLDYEEATLSGLVLILLVVSRSSFTVGSSAPTLRSAARGLGLAVAITLAYGITGFWFLDRREFGVDFTVADSVRRTFRFITFAGDTPLVPHTRHARWFLDSLYLLAAVIPTYALFAFFRPIVYKYSILPQERARAARIIATYGRSSSDYFKSWPDKSYFFSRSGNCFIAYRVAANMAVVLGDPVGPEQEIEETIRAFEDSCRDNDWRLAFYQASEDYLPVYERLGFRKLKVGDDAIVDLKEFSLEGKGRRAFRSTINQLEKSGVHIERVEPPIPENILREVKEVSDEWLQIPGRRERGFTLGMFEPAYISSTPIFAAVNSSGRMLGFVNIIPSYRKGEATIDLMRRRNDAPHGIMDYLFVKLFLDRKAEGFERFSLGMAPMAGFQETEQPSREERAVHYFFQHLNFLFSFTGLRHYKAKFASYWEPKYVVYRNVLDLPRVAIALGRVSTIEPKD
jgi:phosphatidylglycerol lysyltransferase